MVYLWLIDDAVVVETAAADSVSILEFNILCIFNKMTQMMDLMHGYAFYAICTNMHTSVNAVGFVKNYTNNGFVWLQNNILIICLRLLSTFIYL